MKASGNKIWVDHRSVGGPQRVGEIVEARGEAGHARYRVRWEDGRETIVYPRSDATLSRQAETPEHPTPKPPNKASGRARPRARMALVRRVGRLSLGQ